MDRAREGTDAPEPIDPRPPDFFDSTTDPVEPRAPVSSGAAEPGADSPPPAAESTRDGAGGGRGEVDPAIKAAGSWLNQLARTLKICRLYDAMNPTVVRFREELAVALVPLLERHGAITYRFNADEISFQNVPLYTGAARDGDLAFAFYRDGVRGLTLQPGAESRECDAILDAVLSVTGQNLDGDDLVTLLWEANLRHIDIDYIPAEGEAGTEAAPVHPDDGEALLPWPTASGGDAGGEAADGAAAPGDVPREERSEDWALGQLTEEVEATFAELEFMAAQESQRFRTEFEAERRIAPATAALAIANAGLCTQTTEPDRLEMVRFLPRVLRAALTAGAWADAREALRLVRAANTGEWSDETFTQEVLQPVSITRTVEKLDEQGPASVADFIALTGDLGPAALDWLTLALSESQARMTRQLTAEAITALAQQDPAKLGPWLNDPRWFVVRNVVHILGWIGGPGVVPLLLNAVRYPDPRVTGEVVAALQGIELRLARPVLIRALDRADSKLFCHVLQQLSGARDGATARFVTAFLSHERFLQRPAEERRAIYAAIASTGSDEIVEELEHEMNGGNWFDRDQEVHRHAVARCLARIATPRALAALEAGARSKRAPVRQACATALQSRLAA